MIDRTCLIQKYSQQQSKRIVVSYWVDRNHHLDINLQMEIGT